jgi:hypothetical protein
MRHNYLAEVRGRKSGKIYCSPIDLVELRGKRRGCVTSGGVLRLSEMRPLIALVVLAAAALAQAPAPQIPPDDAIRIREFYRLAAQVQDRSGPTGAQFPPR